MVTQHEFDHIWHKEEKELTLEPTPPAIPNDSLKMCEYASSFQEWIAEFVHPLLDYSASPITLAQAKILTIDKYFEWRSFVPKLHKYRIKEEGHICIFHVFEQTYQKIKKKELSISPPKVIVELPSEKVSPKTIEPPSAPLVHVPALFLGEIRE